jgi:ABC-type uncharacterized transport system substrate-binding protein
VALAIKSGLPAIYGDREFVNVGGLMSYGANTQDLYKRVAFYVDKILKGAKPGELPMERPTKFEFVINLKAAKQIGLTIPPNLLARADNVIKWNQPWGETMNRKIFCVAFVAMLFALSFPAEAQQTKKVARIGILIGSSSTATDAFRQGLTDLGYVEGKNIAIEYRSAKGQLDCIPELAAELVRLKVDVIVVSSNPVIIALKKAPQTIPIVMTVVADPVGAGWQGDQVSEEAKRRRQDWTDFSVN